MVVDGFRWFWVVPCFSKYVTVVCETKWSETHQTRQNPRQVSLYYVALFCRRRIFSPGRHYSRELFSYLCVFEGNAKKTANEVHSLPNQMKLV